ncbi:MAG TPA: NAD(P) transhydrogenase subunit alpha [Stellaceae bacterium]|nr:NAD(P) transhydrogenase subunit alpha [Stellaceae bacterium]
MDDHSITNSAQDLAAQAHSLAGHADELSRQVSAMAAHVAQAGTHADVFVFFLTVFVLAVFVGYYVVWRVTPALHSPLMSVTNAISSVIVVGALIASAGKGFSEGMGLFAVMLASVNIFGGFIVTQRMLQMFKKKQK